jgi:uncharacterized protein (TIGR02145 family)
MNHRIFVLMIFVLSFLISCGEENVTTPTDNDNETVTICNQIWMTKNLDVDRYRNGDIIPQVTDSSVWNHLTTGAWCYYNNDPAMGEIYGKLYNWFAVNDPRGLAPTGWHVASDAEWTILTNCLGGKDIAGGKMKETGTIHWKNENKGATNSSDFSALPGGCRGLTGSFYFISHFGFWWSATEYVDTYSWIWCLGSSYTYLSRDFDYKVNGFSVRCIKD